MNQEIQPLCFHFFSFPFLFGAELFVSAEAFWRLLFPASPREMKKLELDARLRELFKLAFTQAGQRWLVWQQYNMPLAEMTRSPSSALLWFFFGWEGSPSKTNYTKKGTLILTSLLEELSMYNFTC